MSNFIKSITPDFILDVVGFLGKIKVFFSRLLSLQNPFKEPPDYEKEDLIVKETSDVQKLGGFMFDLDVDPMAMHSGVDEDGDDYEEYVMDYHDVLKVVEGVCVDGNSIADNTKLLVNEYNLPVSVAKKYAQRFEYM